MESLKLGLFDFFMYETGTKFRNPSRIATLAGLSVCRKTYIFILHLAQMCRQEI